MRIAIVGAGIGGLTAGLALLRRGFDVTIYEQAEELREVGAGLQISANGTRVFGALGILDRVMALSFCPVGKEIRLWNTGQTWKLFDLGPESVARYGAPYVTIHRNDLHSTLAAAVRALNPDAIQLGSRCVGVEQGQGGVALDFAGKPPQRYELVIGADGVHSIIRQRLFGELPATFTGIVAWRGVIPMERLPGHLVRDVGTNWIGPGGHIVHYPIRRGELMNFSSVVENQDWKTESWSSPSTVEAYLADYPGWHEDVHTYIRAIPQPFRWALLSRKPLDNWMVGRVTLLGDAAHPMLPFLASGAAMAIEDAYMLARALEAYRDDHARALKAYQDARIPRTTRVVQGAAGNAERFHNPALASPAGAQAYVDREWEPERVAERYEWLFRYDVTTAPL
ncbi:FAD-dependent monooxygenase [Nitrospirillum amazonense]|uniref:FAD-dependent monooxygenase n=1 Tax=Nitrospirillum amazonense TaxID=28077 RepID=UPI002DD41F77|nr:FAD-dependent monooxygenase [Nitrospirillum amazonense]MEC4590062.1 FAD-dependent monooxygenase [Nitrospirillum amazonense]